MVPSDSMRLHTVQTTPCPRKPLSDKKRSGTLCCTDGRLQVLNAVVVAAHHYVSTHTSNAGAFTVELVDDDHGGAAQRMAHLLPFVSDAFLSEGGAGEYVQEYPHVDFKLAGGSDSSGLAVTLEYAKVGAAAEKAVQILDMTVVQVDMQVVFEAFAPGGKSAEVVLRPRWPLPRIWSAHVCIQQGL